MLMLETNMDKELCVTCDQVAGPHALKLEETEPDSLKKWALTVFGKDIGAVGRVCLSCFTRGLRVNHLRSPLEDSKESDLEDKMDFLKDTNTMIATAASSSKALTFIETLLDVKEAVIEKELIAAKLFGPNYAEEPDGEEGENMSSGSEYDAEEDSNSSIDPEEYHEPNDPAKKARRMKLKTRRPENELKTTDKAKPKKRPKCAHCHQKFPSKHVFRNHANFIKCTICRIIFECNYYLKKHNAMNAFSCQSCRKKLHGDDELKLHMDSNNCANCNKYFKCAARLQSHFSISAPCKLAHNENKKPCEKKDERPYKIHRHQCQRKAKKSADSPTQNDVEEQSPPQEFNCNYCSHKSKSESALASHLQNFGCDALGKMEEENSKLENFECDACKFKFNNKSALKDHEKISSSICIECDKSFNCVGVLAMHRCPLLTAKEGQTPTAEVRVEPSTLACPAPKFFCSYCQEECADQNKLQHHMQVLNCPRCNFAQPCYQIMCEHLKICHFQVQPVLTIPPLVNLE